MDELNSERRLKEWLDGREVIKESLPDLSLRVFALRNKFYTGCGFHYTLESSLGWLMTTLNSFDNEYRKVWEQIIWDVKYRSFMENLESAELNAKNEFERWKKDYIKGGPKQ